MNTLTPSITVGSMMTPSFSWISRVAAAVSSVRLLMSIFQCVVSQGSHPMQAPDMGQQLSSVARVLQCGHGNAAPELGPRSDPFGDQDLGASVTLGHAAGLIRYREKTANERQ